MIDLPNELFVDDPVLRWKNTKKWLQTHDDYNLELNDDWPDKCKGAINAWLLIVGPSPGDSPASHPIPQGVQTYGLVIGKPHPGFYYPDPRHYWDRARCLAEDFFKEFDLDQHSALSLFHHVNISVTSSGKQPSKDKLQADVSRIDIVFRTTKPKCIIALTKRVFEVLSEYYRPKVMKKGELVYQTPSKTYRPNWEIWSIYNRKILVSRTPNHPSRHGYWLLPQYSNDLATIARGGLLMFFKLYELAIMKLLGSSAHN